MELSKVSAKEYNNYFATVFHVFNTVEFSELNSNKCESIHYLLFIDKKVRLGIVLGERENMLLSPFSAPFGGLTFMKSDIRLEYLEEAVKLLENYAFETGRLIKISLPPSIYEPSFISKEIGVFARSHFKVQYVDLNYQFETQNFSLYEEQIARSARKNLHNSFKQNFLFKKLNSECAFDVERVYEIIRVNRESKGFPLRMSLQNVLDTVNVIKADFFVLIYQNEDVAAAQGFHVSTDVVQVIYWGDVPGHAELRAMNYLAYKVFEYYASLKIKIVDIGPSTENGIPNYGLCEFKENIGCSISLKYTFLL